MLRAKVVEGQVEASHRGFLGVASAPGAFSKPPPDFELAGEFAAARRIDPLQSAEAEQLAIVPALDQPESVAIIALIAFQALQGRIPGIAVLNSAQMAHDRGRVHDGVEWLAVSIAPFA